MINYLGMVAVQAQEVRREVPQSKEAYLKSFEHEWGNIHEGKPPELGLKKEGRLERKALCEDVKLKSRQRGLFLVADGVSTANGWYASRETARVMYEMLGLELDQGVENNIQEALRRGENPLERISTFIAAHMIAAVEQADSRIKMMGAMDRAFYRSATTLSVAKLVELPDGHGGRLQRLFFTNIGDSRIYVQRRGGQLEQMTRDDNLLQRKVQLQEVTPQDAQMIDQAPDPQQLESKLRPYARNRNMITRSIGMEKPTEDLGVSYIDLQPGDRIVIVSDGVSDQMLTQRIERTVEGHQNDDQAEEALQQEALRMSLDGRDPRAKGDDISALVKTIEERGPDRAYLHPQKEQVQTSESLNETLRAIRLRVEHAQQEVQQLHQAYAQLDSLAPKRERLALIIKLEKAKEHKATYRYHFEKARLDLVDILVPPRFKTGERVDVWREDFDPPSFDRQPWTVVSYDDRSKEYTVRGAGSATKSMSRYALETMQSGLDEALSEQLYVAEQSYQRMEQAVQAYHKAVERQKSLQDEAETIDQIEKRQRAITTAKTQG